MSRYISAPPAASNRLTRRTLLQGSVAAVGASAFPGFTPRAQAPGVAVTDLGDIWLLRAAGANVLALAGSDGALMIDGGPRANAAALLEAVSRATGNEQVHTLINTHWHPEQTGVNEMVGEQGARIFAHEKTQMYLSNPVYSGTFEGRLEPLAAPGRPTEVTRGDGSLEFDGQRIDFGYLPAAHTDGDLYVHIPDKHVLAVGGVLSGERWPLIDYKAGAWYGGRVRAAEWLAELVEADTRVVPSFGRVLTAQDVVRQRDIYQALFETLIDYMNRGYGPEDAVENNPLAEYNGEFGDPSAFLDGAYRSMLIAYVPD